MVTVSGSAGFRATGLAAGLPAVMTLLCSIMLTARRLPTVSATATKRKRGIRHRLVLLRFMQERPEIRPNADRRGGELPNVGEDAAKASGKIVANGPRDACIGARSARP